MTIAKDAKHNTTMISPWVKRFAPLVPEGGDVLDLACGSGRHMRHFLSRGHPVIALDRDVEKVSDFASNPNVEIIKADLEAGHTWPFPDRRFAGIVVTNYLYRPLFPTLVDALAEGGILIYETFGIGNERHGPPRNPDFLLQNHELLDFFKDRLKIIAFEQGIADPPPHTRVLQRICATKRADAEPLKLFSD